MRCRETQARVAEVEAAPPALFYNPPRFHRTLTAARGGDAGAQYDVGAMYGTGTGVVQSYAESAKWLLRCAAHATPPRHVWAALGDMHATGRGFAKDAAEAVRLYRRGAAAGDARAQLMLANCLTRGVGVAVFDIVGAFEMYEAAAAHDDPEAICNLGICYCKGSGVARDAARAAALFERALAHPRSSPTLVTNLLYMLGVSLVGGDGVPRDVTRGTAYLRRSAAAGNADAVVYLRDNGPDLELVIECERVRTTGGSQS